MPGSLNTEWRGLSLSYVSESPSLSLSESFSHCSQVVGRLNIVLIIPLIDLFSTKWNLVQSDAVVTPLIRSDSIILSQHQHREIQPWLLHPLLDIPRN